MVHRAAVALLLLLPACQTLPPGAQCFALDGAALFPPELPAAVEADREARLAAARAEWAADPTDLDAIVWFGRRTAYLGHYREAVAIYTAGLQHHPDHPELLRHRGHRWISLREFVRAETDLAWAAALLRGQPDRIEPDGLPTPGRPPHSTLQFNVHYHLGLARYLLSDFHGAAEAWQDCLRVSDNDESRVATTHWLWTALARAGEPEPAASALAAISAGMDVVENVAYHRLCLLYRGDLVPEQVAGGDGSSGAAAAYGLGNWHFVQGDHHTASRVWRELLARGEWASFGHIAAEVERERVGLLPEKK